ncbi:MAG: 2-amino-4-hydroxy-6-hydroxymethyldihydropteridine diphosphokinase [Chloroflexi bacterium]|nr:2-amino-4-hydroxy-6-hydroxymethyldihydropteridine diphosphokinase [Chloroflexota bacterium]
MTSPQANQSKSQPVKIYLGLGSNMKDRQDNLRRAMSLLSQKIHINQVSPVYDTAPVGNTEQPRFLNLVCEAATSLTPMELLTLVKGIETNMGRETEPPNSPRLIDIDILFYGNLTINTHKLVIPHPRLIERAFALTPMADIAPNLVHPVNGKSIKELLWSLKDSSNDVTKWKNS